MEPDTGETKLCNNCKREISTANYVMHEMHCRRHIVLCEHCNEPVPRSELEEHFNDLHAPAKCDICQKEFAKEKMEEHKARECERRPVHCEFCELAFPKNEFDAHTDFCGSRTECCSKCQQYIMLKDMLQHENSACRYPQPKAPPPAPPRQPSPPLASGLDPLSMLEMQQLLDGDDFDDSELFSDLTSNLRRELVMGPNGVHRLAPVDHSERLTNGGQSSTRPHGVRRENSRRKADVNKQRDKNLSRQVPDNKDFDIPPDMDYDTMLALQLAHDDMQDDSMNLGRIETDCERASRSVRDRGSSVDHNPQSQRSHMDNNIAKIPCEFCEEELLMEDYINHLEICPLSGSGSNNQNTFDLNNETPRSPQAVGRPSIPVINNLGTPATYNRYHSVPLDLEEDFMLPCEFCEEIFPSEIIIQHQSVCQANGLVTPRLMTPATGTRDASTYVMPGSPSRRLTGAELAQSLLEYLPDGDGVSADRFPSIEADIPHVPQSSSNKYSRPVDRFDADIARPPRRGSKPSYMADFEDPQTNGASANGGMRHAKRENTSAQRARARLNQLLQESGDSNSYVPQVSKTNGQPPAERKSNVDARSVMRKLNTKPKPKPSRNDTTGAPESHRYSGSNNNSITGSNTGSGARVRQRADGIFSPELRLKPEHNPRTKSTQRK